MFEETASVCLHCTKPLKSGRSDKKFCNEACRIEFHNRQKIKDHAEIKKIDAALRKNRKILKDVLGKEGEKIIKREDLLKKGFDFDYHTHHRISVHQKNEYLFCYNYGYRVMEGEKFKVVKSFT